MKKIYGGIVLLFTFVILIGAVPLNVFAADASNVENIERSDVYQDLKLMGFDMSKFMKDTKSEETVSLIDFLEFGYDALGSTNEYGLYLYVYNPSGKRINTNSLYAYKNAVQLQAVLPSGQELGWAKYKLILLDSSSETGLENVFLKFKIDVPQSFSMKVSKINRHYELADIELIFEGETDSRSYGVGGRWSYTGYQAYHGIDRNSSKSTLQYSCNEFLTLELDLHPASWKTETSEKGPDYRYELFSVYFSVPNSVIKKYGDPNDATKGLKAVNGVYSEYKTNGILTNSLELYDNIKPYLNKLTYQDNIPFGFATKEITDFLIARLYCEYGFNFAEFFQIPDLFMKNSVVSLDGVYNGNYSNFEEQEWFESNFEALRYELGRVPARLLNKDYYYSVTVEDGDLKAQMSSYIDELSGTNKFVQWWKYGYTFQDDVDSLTLPMEPIVYVSEKDVTDLRNDEYNAKHLFVSEADYKNLEAYVQSLDTLFESVFLMRFALRDYYSSDIFVAQKGTGNDIDYGNGNYYFEKNMFLDFDVLSLTWEDEHGGVKVIPVTTSPINIVGSITKPGASVNGSDLDGDGKNDYLVGCKDFVSSLSVVSVVLGAILIYVLIRMFPGFFRFITTPIRWLFGGIGKLFGFAGKSLKDRGRERRSEKRENNRAAHKSSSKKKSDKSYDIDDFSRAAESKAMNELNNNEK